MAKRRPKNVSTGSSDKNNAQCGPGNLAAEEKRPPTLLHWCRPVTSKTVSELIDQILDVYAATQCAPIRLMMTSPGGELTAGMHFLQTMRHLGIEIQTVATYRVDSAGIMIFLAGKERYALPHARFLFHQPRTCGMIDAEPDDLHRITDDLEESRSILISLTAEILGQKAEVIDKLCVKGRPISAEKALEIGLIKEILK